MWGNEAIRRRDAATVIVDRREVTMPPAARVADPVAHPLPGMLGVGPGSLDVMIGNMPAWRGVPAAVADTLKSAKDASDETIAAAEKATQSASGTPGHPAAKTAEETTKATAATTMGTMISSSAGGADIHTCATLLPAPPHGPGVVIDGSSTVLINNLPACREGDTVLEAVGPPDKITKGEPTVLIGDEGGGGSSSAGNGGKGATGSRTESETEGSTGLRAAGGSEGKAAEPVSIVAAVMKCECSNPNCATAFEQAAEDGTPLVDRDAPGCAPVEATANPNEGSTESADDSNRVKLVFDPDESDDVTKCEIIGQVQVIQMFADGKPKKPGDYYAGFSYRDVAALDNGTYVDHLPAHTSPDYQSAAAGSHGKKNGGSVKVVLHDAPNTVGGDKGFYDGKQTRTAVKPLDADAVGKANDLFYAKHLEFIKEGKRIPLDPNDPKQADLRQEWMNNFIAAGGKTTGGGLLKVVYEFEVFAWCRKGDDCPKFYGPGIKWVYTKTWEDQRDKKKGTAKITDKNVKAPSLGFLAAYKKFNKVKKYTPCKE